MNSMGHNSENVPYECREDLPPGTPKLTWVKFNIRDFLDDALKMPYEERGFYITALMLMYEAMEGLPADDRLAASAFGFGGELKSYRRLKRKLIERGLLVEKPSGRTSNRRFESEITKYVLEIKNRRSAALEREENKRVAGGKRPDQPVCNPVATSLVHPLPPNINDFAIKHERQQLSKKLNENNGRHTTTVVFSEAQENHEASLHARVLREEEKKIEERAINHPTRDEREGEAIGLDEGPLDPKIAMAARLLGELFGSALNPDGDRGLKVAETWAATSSSQAVLDAVMDFQLKRDDRTEYRPLTDRLFGQYVRQAAANIAHRSTPSAPLPDVIKPPPRKLVPGPIGDGFVLSEDGKLQAVNGHQAIWLERFGGDEKALDLILTSIKGRLRINGTPLEAQIEGMLADKAVDLSQRAKNYATQSEINRAPRIAKNPDRPNETNEEKTARLVAEAFGGRSES